VSDDEATTDDELDMICRKWTPRGYESLTPEERKKISEWEMAHCTDDATGISAVSFNAVTDVSQVRGVDPAPALTPKASAATVVCKVRP
jgi:hypothetical protein